jgi:prepilin-type N-terminal cleavage/methylation domain-containing protein
MIVAAPSPRSRGGYTLLEVIVASAIALLVLIALYMFMQVSLQQASEGRDAVERTTLARGIINRINNDLTPSITAPSAKPKSKSSSSSNQSANASSSASPTTSPSTTTGAATDSMGTESETQVIAPAIPLQAGVIGSPDVLTIYTTRVPDPRYVGASNDGAETDAPAPSDLRRIVYWIGENGGLCRQEIAWVTGENVYNVDGPILENDKTEKDYRIASEVTALSFEYYDINAMTDDSGWVTDWDGRQLGPDNLTPKGPPAAIRVSFTIRFVNARGEERTKDYRHVIPIMTSSGPNSTEELMSPDASDTTSSSSTTTNQSTTTTGGR